MNALFLKDLAQKTRRGLRGRVEAGRSGGGKSYGYDILRTLRPDGAIDTGKRRINQSDAKVVLRIFREYSLGVSPRELAKKLNREGVIGPSGSSWGPCAINGNRSRGTGIPNNELYIGRIVWNRQRYMKDPTTGKRRSRPNPEKKDSGPPSPLSQCPRSAISGLQAHFRLCRTSITLQSQKLGL